ncbi:MAG TPA: hypothetical protein VGH38_26385 [Bryobacteraceae bacterium]
MITLTALFLVFAGVPLTGPVPGGGIARMMVTASESRPTIGVFSATPATVIAGQSTTLKWSVTGATTLNISPVVGSVTGTSAVVKPSATTSYTLTATNSFGTTTAAVSVVVGTPPTITNFKATPAKVSPGQFCTLSWAVTGSPGMIVNPGVGAVTGTSVVVKPSATTSYTLTATNSFGTATAAVSVMVGSAPTVTGFKATPATVGPGQTSTLSWLPF